MLIQTLVAGVVTRASRAVVLASLVLATGGPAAATLGAPPSQHFAPKLTDGGPAWDRLSRIPEEVIREPAYIRPHAFQAVHLDRAVFSEQLSHAAHELDGVAVMQTEGAIRVRLPMPDGTFEEFLVVESPVMEQELADAYPEIKTYLGQGITNRAATVRMHNTPRGFGAQIIGPGGVVMVDKVSSTSDDYYASYRVRDHGGARGFGCLTRGEQPFKVNDHASSAGDDAAAQRSGTSTKRFRVAIAATGEYTQAYGGGSVPVALAEITATFNRVVQIYEQELSIKLVLAANNDRIIFPDPLTDPYPNHLTAADLINVNTGVINTFLGVSNYDVGHVFTFAGPEGIARVASVCGTFKGAGVSFMDLAPTDPEVVHVVAHELGHQFGANHSFNGTQGGCGGNRFANRAFEPGSGSTIMSYATICAGDNLAGSIDDTDLYFHSGSFDEIISVLPQLTCGVRTLTGNHFPTILPLPTFVVPSLAALTFKGFATDSDGDALTYSFEDRDLGDAGPPNLDDGQGPLFRSFPAVAANTRIYPSLSTVLGGPAIIGEPLPSQDRFFDPLNVRLTVRDNRAGNGAVNTADMALQVIDFGAPFNITNPTNNQSITTASTNVQWAVANTNNAILGGTRVRIRVSADNGQTFPFTVETDVANDGTESVNWPVIITKFARVKIEPLANVFFDIGPKFSITPPGNPLYGFTGIFQIDDGPANGNGNGLIDPGEDNVGLNIQLIKRIAPNGTNVNATLVSNTPTVTVVQNFSAYGTVGNVTPVFNATPYVLSISPAHVCGAPISLTLQVTSTQGNINIPIVLPSGDPDYIAQSAGPFTYSYRSAPVNIRDALGNTTFPATASIVIPDDISVVQLKVRMDGTKCSSQLGSTTVGLEHSSVGHLKGEIIGPLGNAVVLFDQPGGTLNRGNNMCQTVFTDNALVPDISTGTYPFPGLVPNANIAAAPYSGSYFPDETFDGFVGFTAQGTWTLRVTDLVPRSSPSEVSDRGNIRAWSLIVFGRKNQVCAAPVAAGLGARVSMLINGRPNVLWPEPEPITADDIADYLLKWTSGDLAADVASVGGTIGLGDGQLTVDDLMAFLEASQATR